MKKTILIAEDSRTLLEVLKSELEAGGLGAVGAADASEALSRLAERHFDLVLTDLVMPGGMDGLELMEAIRRDHPALPVVLVTAHEKSAEAAVAAIRRGAADYLLKPLKEGEALFCVNRLLRQRELEEQVEYLSRAVQERYSFASLVGRNHAMRAIYDTIEIVAETDSTVLITGETGTGKELVARALHGSSPRKDKRFLTINCGALPIDLLESELFGHEKGAFTGAIRTKIGKFEYGDGGTILLDEVGEIPPVIQVKILRVLQEREFERVGGNLPIKVDVRIIAATNKDLHQAIAQGEFREDLFYRLNVVPLHIPPLRERREDIPLLARNFLEKCREKFGKEVEGFSQDVLNRMMVHSWPGNVRELENVIERAVIMERGSVVNRIDLQHQSEREEPVNPVPDLPSSGLSELPFERAMEAFERGYFEEVLRRNRGRIALAARHCGMSPRTLNRKMNRYGLDKQDFKKKNQTQPAEMDSLVAR